MQDTMSPVCVSAPACVVNIVKLSSFIYEIPHYLFVTLPLCIISMYMFLSTLKSCYSGENWKWFGFWTETRDREPSLQESESSFHFSEENWDLHRSAPGLSLISSGPRLDHVILFQILAASGLYNAVCTPCNVLWLLVSISGGIRRRRNESRNNQYFTIFTHPGCYLSLSLSSQNTLA